MSHIIDFYRGKAPNTDGLFLQEIIYQSDGYLEASHDLIQWLFPLNELSNFNENAPILTQEDINEWNQDLDLKDELLLSYDRFLKFFGLKRENFTVTENDISGDILHYRWSKFNHNWLRISRILKCMTLLGLKEYAMGFFELLKTFKETQRFPISDNTFSYWEEAVEVPTGE